MLTCAIKIVGDADKGTTETPRRKTIGSGFLLSVDRESHPGHYCTYLVTAAHLIRDQTAPLEYIGPGTSGAFTEPIEVADWFFPIPEIDLAIAPMPISPFPMAFSVRIGTLVMGLHAAQNPLFNPLTSNMLFPTFDVGRLHLGATVNYIGILEPLDRPMLRGGQLGAVDQVGIDHEDGSVYDCHLVDGRSFGGFSGSPCFYEVPYASLTPSRLMEVRFGANTPFGAAMTRTVLIGMITEHLDRDRDGGFRGPVSLFGVGVVLRSQEILRALRTPESLAQRINWPHPTSAGPLHPFPRGLDDSPEMPAALQDIPSESPALDDEPPNE
jgi:hypothetical protein